MQAPDINQPETVEVESLKVSCDGGGGALGHPKVYLTITQDKENFVDCPYCDKRFVLKEGAKVGGHH
ncbi:MULTISPECIES: zinc-finger domain-containing protein [Curvivirga]|uniref:zinc-finger domain-containing protein n=1 Tax=Curvivirga TaxID=2856846 RepID=UPI0012BCE4C1|nr:zinc-finger domain-containing protein [Curvivirga aplysinae]MTI11361.1 zinc-finger domain-containing protein [Curvivirga aplysinae]